MPPPSATAMRRPYFAAPRPGIVPVKRHSSPGQIVEFLHEAVARSVTIQIEFGIQVQPRPSKAHTRLGSSRKASS